MNIRLLGWLAIFFSTLCYGKHNTQYDSINFSAPHVLENPLNITQDNKGQFWLITEQGVNLFNGEQFVSYRIFDFEQPLVGALSTQDVLILATEKDILFDALTDNTQKYEALWSASLNEQIENIYQTTELIFIQTNLGIYQAEVEMSNGNRVDSINVQRIKDIKDKRVMLSVTEAGVFVLANQQMDFYSLDTKLWQVFNVDKKLNKVVEHNRNLYATDTDKNLYHISLHVTPEVSFTLEKRSVDQIFSSTLGLYYTQNNILKSLNDPPVQYALPLASERIFIDQQHNIWVMSEHDLQVLWSQPLNVASIDTVNDGGVGLDDFDLVAEDYALKSDQLFYRTDSGHWQPSIKLAVLKNSKNILTTHSSIWFQHKERLLAFDKNTFVMTVDIALQKQEVVLKYTGNNLLLAKKDRFVSISGNGVQKEVGSGCDMSCLPRYRVISHVLDGDKIWLGTNRGLHTLDLTTFEFSQTRQDDLNSLSPLITIFMNNNDYLWLIYPNKVAYWDKETQTSKLFYSPDSRLSDATFLPSKHSSSKQLKVMTQQGWFELFLSRQTPQENTPVLNLHQVSLKSGELSYLAPDEILKLSQTEQKLMLIFNLVKQHPEQSIYFRFKYEDENGWSDALPLAQSITLKNLRQGENEMLFQARLEGQNWQPPRRFMYNMPYKYLQTKWVVIYAIAFVCMGLFVFLIERYKRLRIMFDTMKQQTFISSLLECTKDGVWVANKDREIQTVNNAFLQITGFDISNVFGKSFQISNERGRNHEVESVIWQEVIRTGFWTGEIWSVRKDGVSISLDLSVTRVETKTSLSAKKDIKFVGVFSDVTPRKNSEKVIRDLATRDPLTGFANRTLFVELLDRAIDTTTPQMPMFAIMFIDLDNFSKVNATLGPIQGDELLKLVAVRLMGAELGKGITIARLGGDEFGLLIPYHLFNNEPDVYIRKIAHNIKRKLAPSFMLNSTEVNIGASLGVAFYPKHGVNSETLMRCADTALNNIKQAGKNNYCIYETAIDDAEAELLSIESELIRAFDNDEFTVYFQPKYQIQQHAISGFEALVRWVSPSRGMVRPDQFIPMAEENGLIRQLDEAVIKKVCMQIKEWQKTGFEFGHIAINISALNFQQLEFCQLIKRMTQELDVQPHAIELEITESAMMSDPEQTLNNLNELRSLGFSIALDDFGTGHSSLGHLKHFPIDRIKIDKSFVQDIHTSDQDKNIVSVIIQLAKCLDIKVIAEGVEKPSQAYILHILGCNDIQGYMISKPLAIEQVDDFVNVGMDNLPTVALD